MKTWCNEGRGVSITSLDQDKTVIVSFDDASLRLAVAAPLRKLLRELVRTKAEEGYLHFVLNFQNVKSADSTGIAMVLAAYNLTASRNTRLYLCHIRPVIARLLSTTRLSNVLSIFDTEESALAEVRRTG